MTKGQFIDFIIHGLTGGKLVDSQYRKYHPRVVSMAIDFAMGEIFHDLFKRDPSQLDLYAKTFLDITVSYDTAARTMTATLPAAVVQIRDNQGVRWVIDTLKPSERMVMLSQDGAYNLHHLYANRVDDRASFFLRNQKVYLSGFEKDEAVDPSVVVLVNDAYYQVDGRGPVIYNNVEYYNGEVIKGVTGNALDISGLTGFLWKVIVPIKVSIGLIVPVFDLTETDQVVVPSGQHGAVLAFVKAYFNNLGFQDLLNDSKSDNR